MLVRRPQLALLLVATALLAWFACRPTPQMQAGPSLTGQTMGTMYSVKLARLPAGIEVDTLHRKVEQRLQQINALMSTYQHDSELSRFNRYQQDDWFEVSAETAKVVAIALEISRLTQGAFDVTVGPLVNLWNFGPDPKRDQMPTAEQVEQARVRVGYQQLEVRLSPPALRKRTPEIYVDLSAIAKGYGADAIAQLLIDRGIADFMVEIGGDVRTGGTRHDGQPWRIGVEKPIGHLRSVQQIVGLSAQSLATSGDYRNVFEYEGQRYSHAIDPTTGYPVRHQLASVSVIHHQCSMADAWATALLVVGPDAALQLAQDHSLDVFLILRTDQGFEERMTDGFSRFLQTNR
jgi:FAD:protein FMN transferase